MELNSDLLRWILLIGAAPVWWPFLRTLWRDFDGALAEEGGILGRAPSARELERIRAAQAGRPEALISEPWVRRGETAPGKSPAPGAGPAPGGFQQRVRKGGFR